MDPSAEGGFMNNSDYEQIINDLKADSTFCEYKFSPPEINFARINMEDVADSTDEHKLVIACSPTSTLPCTDTYPGPYNFELMLGTITNHKRSWVYSEVLQKVFIDMNKTLLIQFRMSAAMSGLRVRALPVYSMADFLNIPVQRCALHMHNCDPLHQAHSEDKTCYCPSYNWVRHVVQSSHAGAMYDYDSSSDRHSVVVPLDLPQPGSDTVAVAYQFTCKTSCPQGMQRRPISVVFTLETAQGDVLGRQSLSVKICSCPKRDKEREEADNPLSEGWSSFDTCTKPKKRSSEYKGYSKKAKMEASLQLKNANQLEQKKYDDLSEQIAKLTEMVARVEDLQTKMVEAFLQSMRQNAFSK